MENDSRVGRLFGNLVDFLNEQPWFQQIKSKWEELDPQSRVYLQFAGMGSVVILFIFIVIGSMWSVRSLRNEVAEKNDLLKLIQTGNDELRRLKDQNSSAKTAAAMANTPWPAYFESIATSSGIDRSAMTVSSEKIPLGSKDTAKGKDANDADIPKESQFELSLKHINIRQAVQYAFQVENGGRMARVRSLTIDTRGENSGWLDANLLISTFTFPTAK